MLIKIPSPHKTHHKNDKEKQKTRSINDRNAVNGLRATTGVLNKKYGHTPTENTQQENGSNTGNRSMGSEGPSHETNILRQGRGGPPTKITSSIDNQNGKTDSLQNCNILTSLQNNEKSTTNSFLYIPGLKNRPQTKSQSVTIGCLKYLRIECLILSVY